MVDELSSLSAVNENVEKDTTTDHLAISCCFISVGVTEETIPFPSVVVTHVLAGTAFGRLCITVGRPAILYC